MAQIFTVAYNLTGSPGWSIVLLSAAVNTLLLPLYFIGDKIQLREQTSQARLEPKIAEFRRAFQGLTLHMVQKTLYRQQDYHPIYALRSSIGFAIQVPFFIAAYRYLSHLDMLQQVSWGPLANLAKPDALLQIFAGWPVLNLLPVLMTALNLLSGMAYTLQNKHASSQKQLWVIALLFLVLLYNSPAGLLLYWSFSNLYSLLKNLIKASMDQGLRYWHRLGHALKISALRLASLPHLDLLEAILVLAGLFFLARFKTLDSLENLAKQAWSWGILCWYGFAALQIGRALYGKKGKFWLFLHLFAILGAYFGRLIFNDSIFELYLIPTLFLSLSLFAAMLPRLWRNPIYQSLLKQKKQSLQLGCSCCIALIGLILFNSSSLLFSSPSESPQAITVFLQKILPIFIATLIVLPLLWCRVLRIKAAKAAVVVAFFSSGALLLGLLNTFVLQYDYGVMTSWVFDQPEKLFIPMPTIALTIACMPLLYILWLFLVRKTPLFTSLCWIFAASLWLISGYYSYSLANFQTPAEEKTLNTEESVYSYSREQNNVIIIMLDRFIGPYLADILEQEPNLKASLQGFTWYENTLSPGPFTISGLTALLGGHEYSPDEIALLPGSLRDKVNQAYLMLPLLFQRNGYQVTVSDPSWANFDWRGDLELFREHKIRAERLKGRYTGKWLQRINSEDTADEEPSYARLLLMQSLFRMLPSPIAPLIYADGSWLGSNFSSQTLFTDLIKTWSTLTLLSEISDNRATKPTFTFMTNDTPHEPMAMGYKAEDADYPFQPLMQTEPPEQGPLPPKLLQELLGKYSSEYSLRHFYADWATMREIGRYLEWMKEQDVYDNSLIILVSDHGRDVQLPGVDLEPDYVYFMPLLLVKPPQASGPLRLDSAPHSSADVPAFATQFLPREERSNPFTGEKLQFQNPEELRRAHYITQNPSDQLSDRFQIEHSYTVQGPILEPESWVE